MRPNVLILFDEVTPSKPRGTRGSMSIEEVKKCVEVHDTTFADGRNVDIAFHPNQPRCFTSNAMNPNQWHGTLPENPFIETDSTRKTYAADIKAVFKRVCFAHVNVSVISQQTRDEYHASRFGRQPAPAASSSDGCVVC